MKNKKPTTYTIDKEYIKKLQNTNIDLPKYASSIINLANNYSQATRPKNVGQMSDLFPEFIEYAKNKEDISTNNWEKWYNDKELNIKGKNIKGNDAIEQAIDTITNKLVEFINNITIEGFQCDSNNINIENIKKWIENFIYIKTFYGLYLQNIILSHIAENKNTKYNKASIEDEQKNIDGFINNESYSVKSETYKNTPESKTEKIEADYIVYYNNTENKEITYTIENNNTV